MVSAETNHHQVVTDALMGRRRADEQTFCSLAVLEDKLERLKKLDSRFESVTFSPAVKNLANRHSALAAL